MDKERVAIERLREASNMSLQIYGQPLVVTVSGGKDSSVCAALAKRAEIPYELQHNLTTADAPETVRFVLDDFKRHESEGVKCVINYPAYDGRRVSMWSLIPQKLMPPTRLARYCCSVLKERGGAGRFITTGVRWAESESRRNNRGIYETLGANKKQKVILNNDNDDRRRLFESCKLQAKRVCNPIVDWSNSDIWDYVNSEHLPLNPLYQSGFSRVGCIGCPMAGTRGRQREFSQYPRYKGNYIRAFARMLQARKRLGVSGVWRMGTTGEEVFHWWMEDGVIPGQVDILEVMA